jgi:hypothetical protein
MSSDDQHPLGEFQPPDLPEIDSDTLVAMESVAASLRRRIARGDGIQVVDVGAEFKEEESTRSENWNRMLASIPSANTTEHGCRLANYLARQEAKRMHVYSPGAQHRSAAYERKEEE